jgi:hypothetical protein
MLGGLLKNLQLLGGIDLQRGSQFRHLVRIQEQCLLLFPQPFLGAAMKPMVFIYQLSALFHDGGNLPGMVGTKKGNLLHLSCGGGGWVTPSPSGTALHGQEAKLQPSLGGTG